MHQMFVHPHGFEFMNLRLSWLWYIKPFEEGFWGAFLGGKKKKVNSNSFFINSALPPFKTMSKPIASAVGFIKKQFSPNQFPPKQFTPKEFSPRGKFEKKPFQPKRFNMLNPSIYWKKCRNIIAIGRNYAYVFPGLLSFCCFEGSLTFSDHIAELGNQRPSKPFYFLKPWTSIVPPDSWVEDSYNPGRRIIVKKPATNVLIPNGANVHYEVELAVIFNKDLSNLAYQKKIKSEQEYEELWKDSIAGYAIGTKSIVQSTYSSHRFDCKKSTGWSEKGRFTLECSKRYFLHVYDSDDRVLLFLANQFFHSQGENPWST